MLYSRLVIHHEKHVADTSQLTRGGCSDILFYCENTWTAEDHVILSRAIWPFEKYVLSLISYSSGASNTILPPYQRCLFDLMTDQI